MPLDTTTPLGPGWWVKRLYGRLSRRQDRATVLDAYYRGEPPRLPWLPEQAHEEFRRLLSLTKSNYLGLVVDATAERLQVEGFRYGDSSEADADTWAIWQDNRLDADSDKALLEALIHGCAFLLVAPDADDPTKPRIWVEHPTQAIVEYVPGTGGRTRAAGLKVWSDDWTGHLMATLYLPNEVYKFSAPRPTVGVTTTPNWEPREVTGETWPAPNPLGIVPLIELMNNPRLLPDDVTGTMGVSEIGDLIPIQDRICKTLADRLMTQDYGAFPQKWATGYPLEDEQGNATPRIDVGRDRMIVADTPETEFGQWSAAALDPYSTAKREDVKDIASRSRTPAQYLLGEMSNVNGETLKAAESGLVSKVRQRMRPYGDGFEEAMTLARVIAGLPVGEPMETIWRNPEFRTEGELVDALVKMSTLGVPQEALWERWGASQVEIGRWRTLAEAQAARDPLAALAQRGAATGEPADRE